MIAPRDIYIYEESEGMREEHTGEREILSNWLALLQYVFHCLL